MANSLNSDRINFNNIWWMGEEKWPINTIEARVKVEYIVG